MKKPIWTKISAILTFAFILSTQMPAEDWPHWRGPNRNGISYEKGWKPSALNKAKVLWRINVGYGHSTCSVKGNYMVTMGNKETTVNGKKTFMDTVYCVDIKNGKEIWKYTYPSIDRPYPGPRTTPTIDGDRVYTLGSEGDLYCFDLEEGDILWRKHLVKNNLAALPNWGFSGSPVVMGNKLIVTAGKGAVCFNKMSGKTIWKSDKSGTELPSPLPIKSNGKQLIVVPNANKLIALDPNNGTEQWSQPWTRGIDIEPAYLDGKLFTPSNRGFTVLDVKAAPKITLKKRMNFIGFQNFALYKDHAYGFKRRGPKTDLVCVDLKDGKTKWKYTMPQWGALSIVNDKVVVLQGNGEVLIAEASPVAWKKLASAKILKMSDNQGLQMPRQCHCWTIPIISNGKLYIRSNYGEIACIDMKI